MSVIVTDTGFGPETWEGGFTDLETLGASEGRPDPAPDLALDLPSDTDPAALADRLDAIGMIRVDFPSSADGRGFTIARRLRLMGFAGRLRARGHVIADQYAMARRAGFDEIEIADDLAARQPQDQWLRRADWRSHNYQARLRA
ncbi:DUF934 domain-containing protein [Mesobaculum littorinae]|uniref:DUF934 domain-containing protein n=1 Tax=Mesobaculum littorinae TaxID=2486419 RepID=A0A438AJJ7_9RHOB|nr:DUF934 domain-containing protein [Mesobaculum littorinae]RVV98862.1 DUF934 domain-containing protein [Mesobaculum littorinae]